MSMIAYACKRLALFLAANGAALSWWMTTLQ